MKKYKRIKSIMLVTLFFLFFFAGCENFIRKQQNISMENISFRDIPGITEEEVKTIEDLQKQYRYFTYEVVPSTEAFRKESSAAGTGGMGGFNTLFCEWLTSLFGIRFEPVFVEFGEVLDTIYRGEIDFSIATRFTEEQQLAHF